MQYLLQVTNDTKQLIKSYEITEKNPTMSIESAHSSNRKQVTIEDKDLFNQIISLYKKHKLNAKFTLNEEAIEDKDKVNELKAKLEEIKTTALLTGKGSSVTKITICGLVSLVVVVLSWTFLMQPENMAEAIRYSTAVSPLIGVLIGVYGTTTTVQRRKR